MSQEEVIVKAVAKLRAFFYDSVASEVKSLLIFVIVIKVLLITEITVPASQIDMYMGGDRAEQLVCL